LVFTAGTMMAKLDAALPDPMRGGHAASAKELTPILVAAIRAGDVVAVKGSLGSHMSQAVEALVRLEDAPAHAVNG
jgi:UDP-N-acetylmuramoyl-tripeptide--D-alanyl-D-alanine ligase